MRSLSFQRLIFLTDNQWVLTYDRSAALFRGPSDATPDGFGCCYEMGVQASFDGGNCIIGRPFVVEGSVRVAELTDQAGWIGQVEVGALEELSGEQRQKIAGSWAQNGLHEHASVASFGRFLMELMSMGAPQRLISATIKAMADEVRHASDCFAIASAYAGAPVGPGAVEMKGSMAKSGDLEHILRGVIREGCIGETLAACVAGWQVGRTNAVGMRQVLERISAEEAEHAQLAWESVIWMLEAFPRLKPLARETFWQALEAPRAAWPQGESPGQQVALSHGVVTEASRYHVQTHAIEHVLWPCVLALFGEGREEEVRS